MRWVNSFCNWQSINLARIAMQMDVTMEGPFVIVASLGKGLFKLQEVNGAKVCF